MSDVKELLVEQSIDMQSDDEMTEDLRTLLAGDLNAKHAQQVWSGHVGLASTCTTSEQWKNDVCKPLEISACRLRHKHGFADAAKRDKNGNLKTDKDGNIMWNVSYATGTSTWRKNKSTIANALDNGIPLVDGDGNPYGSSLIEDLNAAIKRGATMSELSGMSRAEIKATHRTTLTPDQFINENIDKFIRKLNECSQVTKDATWTLLNENVNWS